MKSLPSRSRALLRLLGQHLLDGTLENGRGLTHGLRKGRWILFEDIAGGVHWLRSLKRMYAGEHFVEHDAERENV